MSTKRVVWDWDDAARRVGVDREGYFNAGTVQISNPRALIWVREDGRIETFSGTDLRRQVEDLAGAIAALGIGPGDRVAGLLGRRPESLTLAAATWLLGGIYVPLFSGFGTDAVRVRLEDSGARLLVTDTGNLASARGGACEGVEILSLDPEPGPGVRDYALIRTNATVPSAARTKASDPATIMYTSGTTGLPKGCVIPHASIITMWPFVEHCMALAQDATLFSTADTGWSFGLYTTGFAPLSSGRSRVLLESGFDAGGWWRAMRATSSSHLATAPTGLRQLAVAGVEEMGEKPPRLEAATTAGEPLTPEVIQWFDEHLGLPVHDAYGLTELGMVIGNLRGPGYGPPVPGSMGVPLPGFEVALLGADGEVLDPGAEAEGRLAVRDNGYLLGCGYWGRDELWRERMQEDWWVTEDIVRRDEEGRYWYQSRSDDVIVTAGYNVGPVDVETAILKHSLVSDAAVVAEPDPRKGQVVVAHVVGGTGDDEQLLGELRELVGSSLGWHAAPRRLVRHDALPRTESGKVKRGSLRAS